LDFMRGLLSLLFELVPDELMTFQRDPKPSGLSLAIEGKTAAILRRTLRTGLRMFTYEKHARQRNENLRNLQKGWGLNPRAESCF
jgi:hypothetical protein